MAHVLHAEAGIDEDEPLLGLDEQAVTGELRGRAAADAVEHGAAEWLHQSAIEVVDAHAGPPAMSENAAAGRWLRIAEASKEPLRPYSGGAAATIRRSS